MHIFEDQIIWKFQKVFLKIFALHPRPLDTCIFWKNHPREKCQNFRGCLFYLLFSKKQVLTLKLKKVLKVDIFWRNYYLRHLGKASKKWLSSLQTQLLVSVRVYENAFCIILHTFTLTDYSTEKNWNEVKHSWVLL